MPLYFQNTSPPLTIDCFRKCQTHSSTATCRLKHLFDYISGLIKLEHLDNELDAAPKTSTSSSFTSYKRTDTLTDIEKLQNVSEVQAKELCATESVLVLW